MMNTQYEKAKARVKEHQRLLDQERENKKLRPNARMEEGTPDRLSSFDFWCNTCRLDFSVPCYKTRHRLFGDPVAVWRTRCPECATQCVRHITHKDHDPYYDRSLKIRRQRNQYAIEMLQAGDYGFESWYGAPYKEFKEQVRKNEEQIIKEELKQGLHGLSMEAQQRLRAIKSN